MATKPPLTLLIAAPRGFCAGVDRAIRIVELALERYGAPVYVRHEIVHNKFVVDSIRPRARFVPRWRGADGVLWLPATASQAVPARRPSAASIPRRPARSSQGTPQAERLVANGRHYFHRPRRPSEVIGTLGQVPDGGMTLIESVEDAAPVAQDDRQPRLSDQTPSRSTTPPR